MQSGKPLGGFWVAGEGSDGQRSRASGQEGRALVVSDLPGPWSLTVTTAQRKGVARWQRRARVDPAMREVLIHMAAGGALQGRLLLDGEPLSGVDVVARWVADATGDATPPSTLARAAPESVRTMSGFWGPPLEPEWPQATAQSGADGTFSIEGLPQGIVAVEIADGAVRLPSGTTARVDAPLRDYHCLRASGVRVRVLPPEGSTELEGTAFLRGLSPQGVQDEDLVYFRTPEGETSRPTELSLQPAAGAATGTAQRFDVAVTAEDARGRFLTAWVRDVTLDEPVHEVVLQRGREVEVQVADAEGRPARDTLVLVVQMSADEAGSVPGFELPEGFLLDAHGSMETRFTDQRGRCTVSVSPSQPAYLLALDGARRLHAGPVRIDAKASASLVLRPGLRLAGRVEGWDEPRCPIPMAIAIPVDPAGTRRITHVEADGSFAFSGLDEGSYVVVPWLLTRGARGSTLAVPEVPRFGRSPEAAAGAWDVRVPLVPGRTVRGVVSEPDGTPVSRPRLLVRGPLVAHAPLEAGLDGRFALPNLPLAELEVEAIADDGRRAVVTAPVGTDELRIALPAR